MSDDRAPDSEPCPECSSPSGYPVARRSDEGVVTYKCPMCRHRWPESERVGLETDGFPTSGVNVVLGAIAAVLGFVTLLALTVAAFYSELGEKPPQLSQEQWYAFLQDPVRVIFEQAVAVSVADSVWWVTFVVAGSVAGLTLIYVRNRRRELETEYGGG